MTRDERIARAADDLLDLDFGMWLDNAEHFSCIEAEALAALFRTARGRGLAEKFIAAHTRGDEEGDLHYARPKD